MAVVIRMKRTGRRNRPCYRISVTDRAFPRDGRTLETLGVYDPASPKPELRLKLDAERAKHWLALGALPSLTVASILKREGVIQGTLTTKDKKRTGRKTKTATGAARKQAKAARVEGKQARFTAKRSAKKAAAKAAAAEAAAGEGEGS